MKLSIEQVEKIARLGRLELTREEKELYAQQLSSILDYVEQLKKVDTRTVVPTSQVTGLQNVFRKDEIVPSTPDERTELLGQVPTLEDDLVKTKSVFE